MLVTDGIQYEDLYPFVTYLCNFNDPHTYWILFYNTIPQILQIIQ